MFRPLIFLASLAAVLGEGVVSEKEDMAAEATVIKEGFVYPGGEIGYGGSGYSYSAKTPYYGAIASPAYSHQSISLHQPIQPIQPAYYPQFYESPEISQGYDLESIKYAGRPALYSPKYISGLEYSAPPPSLSYPAPAPINFGHGGEFIDKSAFDQAKKQLQDSQYQKSQGRKGQEFQQGEQGFKQGQQSLKDVKADSGYYSGEEGAKRLAEDAKNYFGNRHFNKEGQNQAERKSKQGHKKGHKVKGFKKQHNLDESGRTEEFFDEAHDEGGNVEFSGHQGGFGQREGSSFKGGNLDEQFRANQAKKQGHFDNQELFDKNEGNGEHYDSKKFGSSGSSFGSNNGFDEESLLARQQSNKFFKKQPQHVPFYHSY